MANKRASAQSSLSFPQRLNGRFSGVVKLADAWYLAAAITEYEGWFLLDPSRPGEVLKMSGLDAGCHFEGLLDEILREEKGVWSTLVYVQELKDPRIIKVFHPRRAGCGCGGEGGIVPWWVLTRITPEPVPEWEPSSCEIKPAASKSGLFSWIKRLL
ncbi:MAG: hypothetical protein HQL72_10560 [Magnetococcales bacterium]|nr:hypothetical protein [Magnetococcales bacterium]